MREASITEARCFFVFLLGFFLFVCFLFAKFNILRAFNSNSKIAIRKHHVDKGESRCQATFWVVRMTTERKGDKVCLKRSNCVQTMRGRWSDFSGACFNRTLKTGDNY